MLTAIAASGAAAAPQDRYAQIVDGILEAWKTADVVCLGEGHGRQFDSDLRIALVRHPAFPKTVRVIAVEMANPVHQDLLDKFIIDVAPMTRAQLAPIWRDANSPELWEMPIYEQFLRAVHDVNVKLPRDARVRVIAGDIRIDWTKIARAEDLVPFMNRGAAIRDMVSREMLDKNLKGLTIYGSGHCIKIGGGFPGDLYGKYPSGRMWSIWPLDSRPGTVQAQSVFGVGKDPAYIVITGSKWTSVTSVDTMAARPNRTLGQLTDAVVYHGDVEDVIAPAADLTELKARYGAELARRSQLLREAARIRK